MKKSFLVIGMGRFGISIAIELKRLGNDVMAVDKNENLLMDVEDRVTSCASLDCTDIDGLKALGVEDFDVVVVAVATDIESSILVCAQLKELGVKSLVAKAKNDLHANILRKIGVDRVIIPEYETAMRTAAQLTHTGFQDLFDIGDDIGVVEIACPEKWQNYTLKELMINKKYNIKLVAVKRDNKTIVEIDGDFVLKPEDKLLVVGSTLTISKFA